MNECDFYQELISRLLDGELSREEYAAVNAHMEHCDECSAMYAVFASLSDIVGSEDEPLPEDLHENIMAGVRRSAMINHNRRRLSRPLRNSLAAAACAALVLFAAKGLSPAEKADSAVLSRTEAAVMDAVTEEAAPASIEIPAASPVVETQPSPVPQPANTPVPTVRPTASPAPTRDIYLDDPATETNSTSNTNNNINPNNSVTVTAPPTAIVVHTPTVVYTPAPTPAPTANAETAAAPAALSPEQNAAPSTEGADEPAAAAAEAASEPAEDQAAPEAAPEEGAEAQPEESESPSLTKRLFSFFSMARPEAEPAAEENAMEAGPLATEEPETEQLPAAGAGPAEDVLSPENEEEEAFVPEVKLESLEKLTELENLLDGMEEALPEAEADRKYVFLMAEPDEFTKDYRIEVYVYDKAVRYVQIFSEEDRIECLSMCSVEDFEKFLDGLSDTEKAWLVKPEPSPTASPAASELPAEPVEAQPAESESPAQLPAEAAAE